MIRSGFNIFGSFTDSTNIESGTTDVLSKIKFIGRWQKGDKINVKYLYVQPDSWWTRLSNTIARWRGEMSALRWFTATWSATSGFFS